MLVITENGVKIQLAQLKNASTYSNVNTIIMLVLPLITVGLITSILPLEIAIGLLVVIIAYKVIMRMKKVKTSQAQTISGGEILITPAQIEHISSLGQKMVYPLPEQIDFIPSENQLLITDNFAQPLLTIAGFNNPQHATITQAVLQGKQIKTQGKAIKMQST